MKMDSLLKTLQVRPSPPEALVQAYLIHIGDRSEANFRKMLELKGLRKQEHTALVDLFNAHCNSTNNAALPASSPFLAALQQLQTAPQPSHAAAAAASTATAATAAAVAAAGASLKDATAGRFDAATLGSAIMSAAREGVDRLGTPTGESSSSSVAAAAATMGLSGSPAPGETATATANSAAANINENLKNFGKFFRREGAFARFGRGSAPDGGGGGAR
jgi:vacuolar protein sorting-associated protein 53